LKGLAEILVIGAHGNDSRVIEQSAGAINGELERLIRLVTDLLTLSRLDSDGAASGHNGTSDGAAPPSRQTRMDVCATVEAAAAQMALLAEAKGVSLSHECEPLPVLGDSGQLKQVLLNLLDNAIRHTPPGGQVGITGGRGTEGTLMRAGAGVEQQQLVVTSVGTPDRPPLTLIPPTPDPRSRATIEVWDTGSGINPKDLPHIFERFYRGDTSRSRATGNTGLGLAIARTIVEAHNGTIEVQSTPASGTRFTIKLPLAGGEDSRQD